MTTKLFTLELSLQFSTNPQVKTIRPHLPRHFIIRCIRHSLERPARIGLRIVGINEGQHLNQQFRHRDYATNVLTFSYHQKPVVQADIVLCSPVVEQEAINQSKTIQQHCAHLLVHGTLHAQGYTHENNETNARIMEKREVEILHKLGFPPPYV
jgi:probable rRNA maturation factor